MARRTRDDRSDMDFGTVRGRPARSENEAWRVLAWVYSKTRRNQNLHDPPSFWTEVEGWNRPKCEVEASVWCVRWEKIPCLMLPNGFVDRSCVASAGTTRGISSDMDFGAVLGCTAEAKMEAGRWLAKDYCKTMRTLEFAPTSMVFD